MPKVIKQALVERLLSSPRAASFLRDFSQATGLPLRFATALGVEISLAGTVEAPELCAWMKSGNGRRHCAQTIQEGMLEAEREVGCGAVCAAGLREAAVPLRVGGDVYGYLLVGQVARQAPSQSALNRWRHELERLGVAANPEDLLALARQVEVLSEERFQAALRLLESAAGQLASDFEDQLIHPEERLPSAVYRACALVRARFEEPLRLGEVAAEVGLSKEHFCTLFHKSTGLRFVDYLTRTRLSRAEALLKNSQGSITEIALASGFQSISHFNRRFRALKGSSPTEYRRSYQERERQND